MAVWLEQLGLAFFGECEQDLPHFRLAGSGRSGRYGDPQQHVQRSPLMRRLRTDGIASVEGKAEREPALAEDR